MRRLVTIPRSPTQLTLIAVALATTLATTSGCATLVNGSRQTVEFRSVPGCASVQVNGRVVGGTPVSVKLARDKTHHVRIGLPGYLTFDMLLERRASGWIWGNLLLGSFGLLGIVVDALSGAMYVLSPRQLKASALLGNAMATWERGKRLVVMVTLSPQVQPGWRALGYLQRRPRYSAPLLPPAAPRATYPPPACAPRCVR